MRYGIRVTTDDGSWDYHTEVNDYELIPATRDILRVYSRVVAPKPITIVIFPLIEEDEDK